MGLDDDKQKIEVRGRQISVRHNKHDRIININRLYLSLNKNGPKFVMYQTKANLTHDEETDIPNEYVSV